MSIKEHFSIQLPSLSHAYTASLNWITGSEAAEPNPDTAPGIDLGNGIELSAPDVIESHFERLIKRQDAEADRLSVSNSADEDHADIRYLGADQSSADGGHTQPLDKAIGALAPELLPLTKVAEQISVTNQPVIASKEYRTLLNEALMAEQKQQINKQAIGIHPSNADIDRPSGLFEGRNLFWLVLSLMCTLLVTVWYLQRSKRQP